MDRKTEEDICFVLCALQSMPKANLEQHLDDCGNTEEDLDKAMKRLGKLVGMDAGIL